MPHQSDWSYNKQPIKLPLVKVNHVCGDFHPDFRMAIFVFLQTETRILLTFVTLLFTMVEPRTLWMGFKRVQNSIISRRIIVFGIH